MSQTLPAPIWQNRITGHREADPATLAPNGSNWRRHPKRQQEALSAALERVGVVQTVIYNVRTQRLVDGHLRVELALAQGVTTIPVTDVDLAEEDEAIVLASLDPLAAMAEMDTIALTTLLQDITDRDGIDDLLASVSSHAGIDPPEARAVLEL
jgi:hypothetical protein